jgi:drug/metabolite transporter superfamily protein YnfA
VIAYHTAVFCLIQAQLAITDGCWSGKAMLRQASGQSWLLVQVLALALLPFQELPLAWLLPPASVRLPS